MTWICTATTWSRPSLKSAPNRVWISKRDGCSQNGIEPACRDVRQDQRDIGVKGMSEITRGVIGMPFDMAMDSELSRRQFHAIAQELLAEIDRLRTAEGDAMTYKAGMENVAQQRDQLKVELDEDKMHFRVMGLALEGLVAERDRFKAENDALRKDAERYRYMRDFPYSNIARAVGITDGRHFWLQFEEADKAIDKAMLDDA